MNPAPGTENQRWTAICEDAADGSGDMIVQLPDEMICKMDFATGDKFTVEKQPDGSLTLTKMSQAAQG